ncbi:AT-rich interactive domain-containing protein 5B isoform X2 [Sphaerodactylus townsendi]|uniref:AT-rich interactive domain-containing protein 5B isoform X2 n=1 Tax=Sphaerodactylus townsendi TaxID=933632 RepID=UPI002025CBD7|nr:AT-rich interactive domain-containing protein 5B isoform X2 [Sphaerodactylus townsendi]
MEPNSVQWVGSPCGLHGPYIFYKAFQFHLGGRARILSLGDFFFVRCKPEDPPCIAELQLLWGERTSGQLLSSSKLYFLPEDTPQGRSGDHGEDEVIAASEKVTVKLEDLAKWAQADCSKWKRGLRVEALRPAELGKNGQKEALTRFRQSTHNSGLNFKDILKEKADLGEDNEDSNVLILSYPQYCRYRSMLKRIQDKPAAILTDQFVLALGGIAVISKNPLILYCRDTFDHPTLTENESVCDEFAPNLKGRPRKKKPCPQRRDSLNGIRDSNNNCDSRAVAKVKCEAKLPFSKTKNNNSNCKKGSSEHKSKVSVGEDCRKDEQTFLVALYKYMKERKTPIERIPYLGFKQTAQKLGGYETITARRQWKHIYDELGGNPGSTSAATCTRRHYERLILPYERFIKGEEDKPLPPVKPRKQDNVPLESESKTKLSGTKRIKNESQKSKKERDNVPKSQDAPEVLSEQEKDQDCPDQKSLPELGVVDDVKPSLEGHQAPVPDAAGGTPLEKTDPKETDSYIEEVKEEVPPEDSFSSTLVSSDEDAVLDSTVSKPSSPPEDPDEPKQEPRVQRFANYLENDAHEIPFNSFSTVELPGQNEIADNQLPEMPDYIANCTVKVDQLGNEDIHNALKQSPKVLVVQNFDMFKEKEPFGPMNGSPGFNYTPMLYSKGNPGIMSPLAKKKLLSQVSGANLSCSYPYGSPPPLISKKKLGSREEESLSMPQMAHAPTVEAAAVSRPSVIQHVQSFKPKSSEERKCVNETYRHELLLKKVDSECSDFTKQHLTTLAESYALKSEIQDMKDRMNEKRVLHHSHMPTFLTDFYSSPHLHSLYRHTEHHLNSEQMPKYLHRDMYRESENISMFPQHKHPDKRHLCYHPPLHQQEKKIPLEASADDQPTDLSLPKSSHKQTAKGLASGLLHASAGQPESKSLPQFQALSGQPAGLDCHPKACRVSPMTVLAPKKQQGEPFHRSSKLPNLRKMDGTAHPILSHKTNTQPVGAARPLKRGLEDLDKAISEKKIRAVSPLRLPKEAPTKDKGLEPEVDGSKPVHGLPSGSMLEGHKFPLSSPIFTGLYPGTLCSGLSNRIPAGYSHPLQYLKNQTVLSPLVQPLALHSFMVQRQFLTSPGNSQQLYRHLAAAAPVGSSYGDLLHNNLYPLAAINPQAAFPPSQLSSVHPSTKL